MPRKKVALAMAGAGARGVMYFGIFDAFKDHNIPVDYIAACSSSTLLASSYSCGTLKEFRARLEKLDTKELFGQIFETSFNGGIFSLNKIDDHLREFITVENLEDLPVPVAMVAADLINGTEVIFTMGDIFRAIRASCTMPGLFEPVVWGNRVLIDGGLFTIIPVEAAKQFNADIIIGMDLSTNDRIFPESLLTLKKGYNFLAKPLRWLWYLKDRFIQKFWPDQDFQKIDDVQVPNILSIMDKALDHAMTERRKGEYFNCDVILRPNMKGFKDMEVAATQTAKMYDEGYRAAMEVIPKIKELLNEK